MAIHETQTTPMSGCPLSSNNLGMHPLDDNSSMLLVVSLDEGGDYHGGYCEDEVMIDCWDDEEEIDSASATDEVLSILDRAIAICDDIGVDNTLGQNETLHQTELGAREGSGAGPSQQKASPEQ